MTNCSQSGLASPLRAVHRKGPPAEIAARRRAIARRNILLSNEMQNNTASRELTGANRSKMRIFDPSQLATRAGGDWIAD